MPLIDSCSEEAQQSNIAKLIDEGYSQEQAVAIVADMCKSTSDKHISMGTAVKFLDGKRNRVGGYLVRFTDPNQKDLYGEYFMPEPETDYMLKTFRVIHSPVLYQHGMDATLKSEGITGIGTITAIRVDEAGIWAEAQLEAREDYLRRIQEMVEEGILSWSSGSLPQLVEVDADTGHIRVWPIVEGSLTPTPAMPAGTEIMSIRAYQERLKGVSKEAKRYEIHASKGTKDQTQTQNTSHDERSSLMARKQLDERIIALVQELASLVVGEVVAETGAEMTEEEAMPVIEEVAQAIEEVVAEEPAIAEAEEEEMDEEAIRSIIERVVNENMEKCLPKTLTEHIRSQEQRRADRKSAAQRAIGAVRDSYQPSGKSRVGAYRGGQSNTAAHITVEEERRFAGITGDQMALGVKVMAKAIFPNFMPANVTLNDLGLSESYIRTMVFKNQKRMVERQRGNISRKSYDELGRADDIAFRSSMGALKADELMATAITSQGLEWVFTDYDVAMWDRAREETQLVELMTARGMRTMDVAGKTMEVKLLEGSPEINTISEARSVDGSGRPEATVRITPAQTGKVTIDMVYHAGAVNVTDQLNEQSLIDLMPVLDQDLMRAIVEARENTFYNGDTVTTSSNINTDSAPPAGNAKPDYLAWDGIRKNWLITYATDRAYNANNTMSHDVYLNVVAKLDRVFRTRKSSLLWVIDHETELATRRLPEFLTFGVAGERQTIYSGTMPPIDGIEVYTCGFAQLAQADGTISDTAGNNTLGTISLVNPAYWQYGRQREILVEFVPERLSLSTILMASVGHVLVARGTNAAAGARNVNITLA